NLLELQRQGPAIWLDYIHRNLIISGELKRLVEEAGLRGVTSNPTIFEKAIAETRDYDGVLCKLLDARAGSCVRPDPRGRRSRAVVTELRVFINQLRRKIEPDPHHPRYIITEPWVGYRFVPNE